MTNKTEAGEAFEAWFASIKPIRGGNIFRTYETGEYVNTTVQIAWLAWQASRTAQSEAKPDALAGWQFKRSEYERYWVILTPTGCFALARDADDEKNSSRILAQLAAALSQRGEKK